MAKPTRKINPTFSHSCWCWSESNSCLPSQCSWGIPAEQNKPIHAHRLGKPCLFRDQKEGFTILPCPFQWHDYHHKLYQDVQYMQNLWDYNILRFWICKCVMTLTDSVLAIEDSYVLKQRWGLECWICFKWMLMLFIYDISSTCYYCYYCT